MTPVRDTPAMRQLQNILQIEIRTAKKLAGGDVSGASLITTATGEQLVVKQNSSPPAGMFTAEADGLQRLGASGSIRLPKVLLVNDAPHVAADERLIAMEYVSTDDEDARFGRTAAFGQRLGAALATLHSQNPSTRGEYGLEAPSFLGRRPLDNAWSANWGEFYALQRISPVLPECRDALGERLYDRTERLRDAIPTLLADIPHAPCLIHGDLWSGNYLVGEQAPVLIDPAAFYGHPEHEWAYLELFGGFPPGMRDGYDSIAPLGADYEHRRPLLQLFHILVHVAHFGQPYVPAVHQVCRANGY